jgi:hypothetical protein
MLRAARQALKQASAAAVLVGQAQCTGPQRTLAASCLAYTTAAPATGTAMCDRRSAQKHHDGPQAAPQGSRGFIAGSSSIIYPAPSAKVGSKAPDFTLPGVT